MVGQNVLENGPEEDGAVVGVFWPFPVSCPLSILLSATESGWLSFTSWMSFMRYTR